MTTAGIVLAGGRSSRMGTSKAALEWHGSTLLRRTAALLGRVVDGPVIVVTAPGQELPALPGGVEIATDPVEGRGPLQGIATGLAAAAGQADRAFLCATDLPFLHPAFVTTVLDALTDDFDVGLPVARGYPQPLAAAYRTALAPRVAALIEAGRMRPAMLFEQVRVRRLTATGLMAELAATDPDLDSLLNVNSPEDYRDARARPGATVTARHCGSPRPVTAANLAAAAAAVGVDLGRHLVTLNGEPVGAEPSLPLVAGDVIEFHG